MKLAIFQSYFFPYIGYFQLINAVDKFIVYDHLKYIKNGWIQRNRIVVSNQKDIYITIPVQERSSNKRICELAIDHNQQWQKKILKQLHYNYTKSPFFNEVFHILQTLLTQEFRLISEFNIHALKTISELLNIQTTIIDGSNDYISIEEELTIKKTPYDTKTQRIIRICQKEKADTFINSIGGQKLYDKTVFEKQDIRLFFIKTDIPVYPQQTKEFIPDLSIIDVLFNCGIERTKELLLYYKLI